MSNNSVKVQPSATGTNLQTFENTVNAVVVDSEAVTLVRSSDNTEVGTAAQPLRTDPTGTTSQPVSQGTPGGSAWPVSEAALDGCISANKVAVSGTFFQANQPVTITPATSGGTSDFHLVSAGSNNDTNIKNAAGQVFGWNIFNNAAYPVYVKLFNKATTPVSGTDTPVRTIGVQAGTQFSYFNALGMAFSLGIGVAITKGIADNDNTAILANDCVIDVDYK